MAAPVSAMSVAEIGALVGDTARARMLDALIPGRALTAGELAWHAGIGAPAASEHLAKLAGAGLLAQHKQGRHRYYRLASSRIAEMLEGIAVVASIHMPPRHRPPSRIDAALREARTCYDHLAGRLGVGIADALSRRGYVAFSADAGAVTKKGEGFFARFGMDLAAASAGRRCFCRPCLDWSERRPHIAGAIGAGIAARCFELGWIERVRDSRAVTITRTGARGFKDALGMNRRPE
ncbi:MAG: ArsR/SmtB family transcription factor [Rhodospirillales bacterium]